MRALLLGGWVALACAGAPGQADRTATRAPEGLSQQEIQEVVRSQMKVIEGCAVIAGATSGSLVVAFEIAPSGAVERAAVKESSIDNAVLEACLVRTFTKMTFPAAEASTSSEFPFRLRGGS